MKCLVTMCSLILFQLFFIDHSSKTTSFMDPRLPIDAPFINASKLALPSTHHRRSRSPADDDASRVGKWGSLQFCQWNEPS